MVWAGPETEKPRTVPAILSSAMSHALVATLGPASLHLAAELFAAGATAFRLNASHLRPEALAVSIARARTAVPACPIVVDLQGAKMRVGEMGERALRHGDEVRFAPIPFEVDARALPLPHPELFAAARAGMVLRCDDDRLRFEVLAADAERIEARALGDGVLKGRKGVNLVDHPVRLADLTAADLARIAASVGFGDVAYALSFMARGDEARWLRTRVPGATVVGKIERQEALDNLSSIDEAVDVTWICRGDLGSQLGLAGMARAVAAIEPRRLRRPCLMAGQVFEHLTAHATPTRSEVCHLHDLLGRGYAGIVLSDETAIGHDPLNAVRTAAVLLG